MEIPRVSHYFLFLSNCYATEKLVKAVGELSKGIASKDTLEALKEWERPLPPELELPSVKIFARRIDADVHNTEKLMTLQGIYKLNQF